jgi:predicted RNA-binding Zn ribbon-like protein
LNRLLHRAGRRRTIDPTSLEWSWPVPANLAEMVDPVVWNAGDVLTTIDRGRLRYCPSCDWIFHDTTRNRSRRWCDMRDCGSRDKALRYYHRRKPSASRTQIAPNE